MAKRLNIVLIVVLLGLMLALDTLPIRRLFGRSSSAVAIPNVTIIRFGGEDSFAYNPANVTINAGESVEWQGNFSTHPLASDTQFWYPHREGTTFRQAFTRAGTYPFYCEVHGAPNGAGMSGVITVE